MQKIFLLVLVLNLVIAPAWAANDDSIISLFDGTPAEKKVDKNKPEEENSIFSFLNFKSKKKEAPVLNVADEKRLDPFQQTQKLADTGDVNAQLVMGYSYLYGDNGVDVDYDKAFAYYAKAAMQNDNVALNNLGSLYYSGIGIGRDTTKAAILFEKATKLGNAEATVNLAFMMITGNGIAKDNKAALDLFDRGAKLNNPTAKFMSGYAYYKGNQRPRDYKKAAELIKSAAVAKFDEAQYVLALMYINGMGLPQNYGNAVKYLKEAVAQGNVSAMTTLGDILVRGEKYSKDLYTAHVMFNLAAVRGAPDAAGRRDLVASKLKIDEVLQAQAEAERFQEKPSELTNYIHQTFGDNVSSYIDNIAVTPTR